MFGFGKKKAGARADSAADSAPEADAAPASSPPVRSTAGSGSADNYSGFWLRVLAAFADSGMLFFASFVIAVIVSFAGEMGAMIGGGLILLLQVLYWPVRPPSARPWWASWSRMWTATASPCCAPLAASWPS
ncbi:MAG: hypothetical protein FJY55_04575 [Betaproteobacteria bacterium]|nr:hypothetical protein [Betaproteobacteria bacterium]